MDDRITLAAARVNAGYKQKDAALLLGISARTLRNYENDGGRVPSDTATRMAGLYHVSKPRLFFGTKAAYYRMMEGDQDDGSETGSQADR